MFSNFYNDVLEFTELNLDLKSWEESLGSKKKRFVFVARLALLRLS